MREKILEVSNLFWNAMENADEAGMRAYADPACYFTHIGISCGLEKEIEFYTNKAFQPTSIVFHNKDARVYGNTGVVSTDCDYTLLLNGEETTHHFMVTEVYRLDEMKLVQFTFTALVY